MRWQPFPLVGGAYTDDARPWSHQDTVNYIPVVAERPGGRSDAMLRGLPGLVSFASIPGTVRGLHDAEGQLFAVVGTKLYQVATNGAATVCGTVPGVGKVSITHNQITGGNQVVVANGVTAYVWNTTDSTFAQITDDGFPGAKIVDFVDQYIVYVEPMGRYWGHSDLADATSYNALDRYEAESAPDRIVTLIVTHGDVFVLGERTGEFFYNTGEATGTFQRREGTEMEVGCAAARSVARIDNSVCWLGHDGMVYRLDGYNPKRISTHAIEQAISRCTWKDAFAFVFDDRGHKVYYLTFPDGQTWGYDMATGEWHRRASKGQNRWRLNALVRSNGRYIGGDRNALYRLDWDVQNEAGEPLERRRRTGVLHDAQNRLQVHALELVFDTGTPAIDTETVVEDRALGWLPAEVTNDTTPDGSGMDYSTDLRTATRSRTDFRFGAQSGVFRNSGKFYFEVLFLAGTANAVNDIGLAPGSFSGGEEVGGPIAGGWSLLTDGRKYRSGTATALGSLSVGDTIMVAVDFDNGKLWFGRNGTWYGSGNPGSGTNAAFTGITGTLAPAVSTGGGDLASFTLLTRTSEFQYAKPTGFYAWGYTETTLSSGDDNAGRVARLAYSKDGGRTFSDPRQYSLGVTGDFGKRVLARRMGSSRQWLFDISTDCDAKADLIAASIQTEGV